MSLEIIGLIIHPFINVAAFLVILSKITKIKHTRFFVSVCFGLEIIVPFIIAFLGHIFSFSSTIPSYTLSFFLPLFSRSIIEKISIFFNISRNRILTR